MKPHHAVLIIAHYETSGRVSPGLLAFLEQTDSLFDCVYFVSTGLNEQARQSIEGYCRILVRPNIGYDFYSYRLGFLQVWEQQVQPEQVTIMNSSFIISDVDKFVRFVGALQPSQNEVAGASISYYKKTRHIQSFLVSFPKALCSAVYFQDWWKAMQPLDDREQVIDQYEIGLSKLITSQGFKLKARFETRLWDHIFSRIRNPMFGQFQAVESTLGIYKEQLARDNPFQQDLGFIAEHYSQQLAG